jgi:hypothetical protein
MGREHAMYGMESTAAAQSHQSCVVRPLRLPRCMLQNTCHGMRHVACCIDCRDSFVAQFAAATARDHASATPSKVKTTNLSTLSARVVTSVGET